MQEQDKKEIRQIFNEGIEQLILPRFDEIYKEMATKKELQAVKNELKEDIEGLKRDVGQIDRKLNAEISWRDDASKRIKGLEIHTGLVK